MFHLKYSTVGCVSDVSGSKQQTVSRLSSSPVSLLSVGYAWLPLLKDGRVIMNESQIPVAANLPAGYLSCQEGAGKVECILKLFNSDDLASSTQSSCSSFLSF